MPELFSRMDNLNWLTPSIADILDQGSAPPGGDGSIRERMLMIQQELDDLETPAKIVNVRLTPSYTLYIAKPETIGRMRNRRTVTNNEIKESIKQIAENHRDWLLGFMPQLRQDDAAVGILLRTSEHRPVSLRRLLVRGSFRKHPSQLAFVLGITLEQQMIIESIENIGNLLVVGSDNAKQHFIRSTLLTLIMLNTPSELRVAIAGESSESYKYLVGAPHALGRILTTPIDGRRLLDGLVKEIQRRRQSINDEGIHTFEAYNELAVQQGKSELPRIVLILDSLTDKTWTDLQDSWESSLFTLLKEGSKVGIHLIITIDDEENFEFPTGCNINLKVVTRASGKDMSAAVPNFHASLLRFVDTFIEKSGSNEIVPVELCAISNSEIKNVVEYWRQMSKQRYQDMQATKSTSKTGVTDVLTSTKNHENRPAPPPTPPVPTTPSVATLARATQKLGAELATIVSSDELEAVKTENVSHVNSLVEAAEDNHVEKTTILSTNSMSTRERDEKSADSQLLIQSMTLCAYLGWISKGALCDIFLISDETADRLLAQSKEKSIVENRDYPVLRYIKAIQNNPGDDVPD